jgi:hypothetical protein
LRFSPKWQSKKFLSALPLADGLKNVIACPVPPVYSEADYGGLTTLVFYRYVSGVGCARDD